jgi:prepilin-type N-terminal cleavage/methylation domain-containing protein
MSKWWQQLCKRAQAGDTLIEVMLAIVVLSMVLTGAYQSTTSSLRIGQNSIERTQASNVMSSQAEALRTLRDQQGTNATAASVWNTVSSKVTSITPSTTVCNTNGGTPTTGSNPFWINTSGTITSTDGTHTTGYLKYWVESYRASGATTNYIDFYIRGCWQGIGNDAGVQNTGIVIRLMTS